MKKINKRIVAVSCLLVLTTALVGCSVKKTKIEKLDKTKIDSFSSINLNVDVAEINIIPTSDEFAIEYSLTNQTVDYKVADDVLTIKTKQNKSINIVINKNDRSYIKIYVPEGSKFVSLDYNGDVGGINFENITFDDVNITTDVGDVTLADITVNKKLSVTTDVGNINVSLNNSDCSYKISADVADININGSNYDGMEIEKSHTSEEGPNVNIETDCGKINFEF